MANDLIPFKEDGERVTCTPTTAVVGKRLVKISGDKNADGTYSIAPCGAGEKAFGVACWDAAIGAKVTVITITSGHIVPVLTGGAITAGASVKSGAAGVVVAATAADKAYGVALSGAADASEAIIQLAHHIA